MLVTLILALLPMAEPEIPTRFIAVEQKQNQVVALKTAVATYTNDQTTVDLIGAVHIGDKQYYKQLNTLFGNYDALLYEMVGPPGVKPDRDNDLLAIFAKLWLDLDGQKQQINYKKSNFVHADLSPDQMKIEMEKRGEDSLILSLRVLADVLQQGNQAKNKPPVELLELGNDALSRKRFFARMIEKTLVIPALDNVLVKDRNKEAIRVLEMEIKNGRKNLGIFYGAAHLPDLQERLLKLGFKYKTSMWIVAWDMEE